LIDLLRRATFHGPNPYSGEAVMVFDLKVDEAAASRSDAIMTEIGQLSSNWFPGNADTTIEDPSEALVAFLLRWSLAALNWIQGFLDVSGYQRLGPGMFRIWVAFHDTGLTNSALALAVRLANRAEQGRADSGELETMLDRLWKASMIRHPDSSDQIVMMGARSLDIPIGRAWNTFQMWQFGWGSRSEVICSAGTNYDGYNSGKIIARKDRTKNALRALGMPVPQGVLVRTDDEIESAVEKIGLPCVVKPIDLGKGVGISANLQTLAEVRSAVGLARTESTSPIMIETFIEGDDHRLLIAGGRLAAAVQRRPPAVTGDGKRTIRELTDQMNVGRTHPDTLWLDRLPAVRLDENALQHLANQELTPETVLAVGRTVKLRSIANISTGGSAIDVTPGVHPDIRKACEMIARTFQVNVAGFDYVTTDISQSWRDVPGGFIELNLTPALIGFTLAGWPAAEAGKLMLNQQTGRIPIDLIVVPEALLAEAESRLSDNPPASAAGWASQGRACVGTLPLLVETGRPWSGIGTLLANRTVERATLLISGRQLQIQGLPVDRADLVWNCDPSLPDEWQEVLRLASHAPMRHGQWPELLQSLSGPERHHPVG
jgi:D-alanine-D-alanine ligase-like ATP-grasp enzyme